MQLIWIVFMWGWKLLKNLVALLSLDHMAFCHTHRDMPEIIQCGATCLFPQVTHIFLKPLLLTALKGRISLIWRKEDGWTIMFCMLCQARSDNSSSGMSENPLVQYTAPSLWPTSGNNTLLSTSLKPQIQPSQFSRILDTTSFLNIAQ